jgi:nitrite reductase/ring-hydroxylating ferredoxin subunit
MSLACETSVERPVQARMPLPAGWFCVGASDELPPGAVRPLHYLDADLVILRGESGDVRVFDAYCPHMGAHLGMGGRVAGEDLICPFHAWRWGPQGEVVDVPYSKAINRTRTLQRWEACEQDGFIYLWSPGGGDRPRQAPASIPHFVRSSDERAGILATRTDTVRAQLRTVAETAADTAHAFVAYGIDLELSDVRADDLRLTLEFDERNGAGVASGGRQVDFLGPGVIVDGRFGPVTYTTFVTPVDAEHCELRTVAFASGRDAGDERVADIARRFAQLDSDITIWQHLHGGAYPCDGDPAIKHLHTWLDQYSSPRPVVGT